MLRFRPRIRSRVACITAMAIAILVGACGTPTAPAATPGAVSTVAPATAAPNVSGSSPWADAPSASPSASPDPSGSPAASPTPASWPVPTGTGSTVLTRLPPPWAQGGGSNAMLTVYFPPGYDASPARRYPVLYEVPFSLNSWQRIGITGLLDKLITAGRIPPVVVAFVGQMGAPIPDSECVDSVDGRQQLETYISKTVVAHMDATYRTIPLPAARAVFGMSQGGFCASMLLLRHPDVFGQAISISGYYQAGLRSSATPAAWPPFAGDSAAITAHSPLLLADSLSPATRASLYIVLAANPNQAVYGTQYKQFAAVLKRDGYRHLLIPSRLLHGMRQAGAVLPDALVAVARRWAALGVTG